MRARTSRGSYTFTTVSAEALLPARARGTRLCHAARHQPHRRRAWRSTSTCTSASPYRLDCRKPGPDEDCAGPGDGTPPFPFFSKAATQGQTSPRP